MDVMVESAAGLDVHKDTVVACVLRGPARGPVQRELATFGTTTRALLDLREWLEEREVEVVVMEATGIYWRPVFNVLQHETVKEGQGSGLQLVLANPHRIKNVPGRKSDLMDAEWIAQLARHGLVEASFVPPRPIREIRDLARYRKKLVVQIGAEKNRAQKVLEDANIKLGSVATDIFGLSGRAMLRDLIAGETNGAKLAERAQGKLRSKRAALVEALEGRPTAAHRFLLLHILRHVEFLEALLEGIEGELEERLRVWEKEIVNLCTIPGVGPTVAAALVAEMGTDMSVFPSAAHAASWAGVSPGSFESAGKKKSGRTLKGRTWLKTLLCEAAWAAIRAKNTYLSAKYYKLRARRGPQRALMAVAHKILVAAYWILRTGQCYLELGGQYLERLHLDRRRTNLVKALESLGYSVRLEPKRDTAADPSPA